MTTESAGAVAAMEVPAGRTGVGEMSGGTRGETPIGPDGPSTDSATTSEEGGAMTGPITEGTAAVVMMVAGTGGMVTVVGPGMAARGDTMERTGEREGITAPADRGTALVVLDTGRGVDPDINTVLLGGSSRVLLETSAGCLPSGAVLGPVDGDRTADTDASGIAVITAAGTGGTASV